MGAGLPVTLLLVVVWCLMSSTIKARSLEVYHQERITSTYLYQTGLPEMTEMTVCFWAKLPPNDDDNRWEDWLFSISRDGQDNEFMIGWRTAGVMALTIQNYVTNIALNSGYNMEVLWTNWHKHCFTWKVSGSIKWYVNIEGTEIMKLVGSASVPHRKPRSGGYLILLQEQDAFGGGLNSGQTVPGRLADFNMWQHEKNAAQLNSETCGVKGDVVSWDTLTEQGSAVKTQEYFPECSARALDVYHQELTTSKYLYQTGLPEMTEMTVCFWAKLPPNDDDNRWEDWLFSTARTGETNEFMIGWRDAGIMALTVQNHVTNINLNSGYNMETLWTNWHKHCFTWKVSGNIKWYVNIEGTEKMKLVGSASVSNRKLRSGGYLILLQEQDSVGGSLNVGQASPGQLANFNMWKKEMTLDQLNSGTCGGQGDVVSWSTLQEKGSSVRTQEYFPTCTARSLEVYHQELTTSKYLYQNELPEMTEMTACFWAKLPPNDDDNRREDWLFTISRLGMDNEFMIGWRTAGIMALTIRNYVTNINLKSGYNMENLWINWHKHCFTWKVSGSIKWYASTGGTGQMELVGSASVSDRKARSGGYLILLQEQDGFGSGLSSGQTVPGLLADFNMWQHEKTADQLNSGTCGNSGDVVSWNTLREQGSAVKTQEYFPACNARKLEVYHQELTTSKYLYQTGLPEMTEMTVCFWVKLPPNDDDERWEDWIFSTARTGETNEFMIGWRDAGIMALTVQNHVTNINLNSGYNMEALWTNWHKHCFTWKVSGSIKWYANVDGTEKMQLVGSASVSNRKLRSGGYLILLQEQDSVGGSLNVGQASPGQLADFNMWKKEMTLDQLNSGTCGGQGDVVSWNTLQEKGSAVRTQKYFPTCHGVVRTLEVYHQEWTTSKYLYKRGLPAMSELTSCFWAKLGANDDDNRSQDWLISIARSGEADEFMIGWKSAGTLALGIQDYYTNINMKSEYSMEALWTNWHKHCFTWKASGSIKWYADNAESGKVELVGSGTVSSRTVRSGGSLLLMQEQDGFESGLSYYQVTAGQIAEFNMWEREMTLDQLNSDTCGARGDVVSWSNLLEKGASTRTRQGFPACRVISTVMSSTTTTTTSTSTTATTTTTTPTTTTTTSTTTTTTPTTTTTTPTTTTQATTTPISINPYHPCNTAVSLTENWRNYNSEAGVNHKPGGPYSLDSYNCDLHPDLGWFRFSGEAGHKILTVCPFEYNCGTRVTLWMDPFTLWAPGIMETKDLYGSAFGNCKAWVYRVHVMRCSSVPTDIIYRYNGIHYSTCYTGFCGSSF